MFESNVIAICFFVVSTRLMTWPSGWGTAIVPLGDTTAVGSNATVVGTGDVVPSGTVVAGGGVAAGGGVVASGTVVAGTVALVDATTNDVVDVVDVSAGADVIAGWTGCGELEAHAPSNSPVARTAQRRAVEDQSAVVAPVGDRSQLVLGGTRGASAAGVPKAAASVLAIELVDNEDAALFHPLDHELSDAISAVDLVRLGRVGVDQRHLEFAPIA
jgi:hypothetical protein